MPIEVRKSGSTYDGKGFDDYEILGSAQVPIHFKPKRGQRKTSWALSLAAIQRPMIPHLTAFTA